MNEPPVDDAVCYNLQVSLADCVISGLQRVGLYSATRNTLVWRHCASVKTFVFVWLMMTYDAFVQIHCIVTLHQTVCRYRGIYCALKSEKHVFNWQLVYVIKIQANLFRQKIISLLDVRLSEIIIFLDAYAHMLYARLCYPVTWTRWHGIIEGTMSKIGGLNISFTSL